ncbi:putative xeroderma pigmentosum G I-region [Lyophyllum shimeji]|uniref:Xeroderma pigmentosum G I-region n=1 Tax=Lyophyllum shimeji TaxID=47721 RepID=A0A9P3UPH6_LYOSH|nr:putative xeroderma pigmentosum G I-region [Lyophyllum shimeji]
MGVKSLWSLLTPVGRPVLLETVEGKAMAIDSSIWIYQFQATMRDKDGRALVNAHILGFLRRIAKLLFYGIKPVFVFDGGAPVLKKATLRERREKKSGAVASHAKLAEKLLAAQMRREALNHADPSHASHATTRGQGKQPGVPSLDNDNTVYLEDVETSTPKTPAKKKASTPSSSSNKAKFYDHDPYKLPEVDLEAAVAKATRTAAPDPRLATEDELRAFIEEMRPEDFDITSPAFRELPTEVQYEIVGDLRLKSRQTSYARLQNMLRNAPTPLDFSKQQIKNLQQRNTLTQQLLITTDSIGSAHISIPVRIASERNKEYVLMKNEGESGGWILGIRDDGTRQKPIKIDHDDEPVVGDDSDEEMEEVPISVPAAPDQDLREYRQTMALSAIGNRASQQRAPPRRPINKKSSKKPLFELDDDDELVPELPQVFPVSREDEEDDMLTIAIQESLEQAQSMKGKDRDRLAADGPSSSKLSSNVPDIYPSTPPPHPRLDDDGFVFETPSRLETALTFAHAGLTRPRDFPASPGTTSVFGRPTLLSSSSHTRITPPCRPLHSADKIPEANQDRRTPATPSRPPEHSPISVPTRALPADEEVTVPRTEPNSTPTPTALHEVPAQISSVSDEEMEEVIPAPYRNSITNLGTPLSPELVTSVEKAVENIPPPSNVDKPMAQPGADRENEPISSSVPLFAAPLEDEAEGLIPWSRSPSPSNELATDQVPTRSRSPARQTWDAAEEMDPHAEEGEYARFISQVKGKNIEDVRRELDDEIKPLNQQRKAAMRDSEDVTQQTVSQIMAMLRLFGIPYITAPMEAEAQCAELVSLGLVDGVITDDSDVFLFGAQRVFKNMFNQSKTVECFLLTDLSRDLGLERDTLIRLAYLLGSDYVEGLPGVGPVVAMELLKEFPGEDGLHKFKEWWTKVQTGKDKEEDSKSKFRRQFKKKFKDLYLSDDWPNPAVRDAYYHPTVDSSDEPFKWGLPDLDALRAFFRAELGWGQEKVDDILLPIIQKMNKRGQAAALNKQSNLGEFFDMSAGSGTYAPRKRQAYTSKRLQNVVDDFRKKRGRDSATSPPRAQSEPLSEDEAGSVPVKKRSKTSVTAAGKANPRASFSRSVPKKPAKGKGRAKKPASSSDEEDSQVIEESAGVVIPPDPLVVARLRPRPKPRYTKAQETEQDEDGEEIEPS